MKCFNDSVTNDLPWEFCRRPSPTFVSPTLSESCWYVWQSLDDVGQQQMWETRRDHRHRQQLQNPPGRVNNARYRFFTLLCWCYINVSANICWPYLTAPQRSPDQLDLQGRWQEVWTEELWLLQGLINQKGLFRCKIGIRTWGKRLFLIHSASTKSESQCFPCFCNLIFLRFM